MRTGKRYPLESFTPWRREPSDPAAPRMTCPRCSGRVPVSAATCPLCGFPFVCDIAPIGSWLQRAKRATWRHILGLAAILFLFTSGVFMNSGYEEYHGLVNDLTIRLVPEQASGIAITGPSEFELRSELALALLKLRAPDYYWRMQDHVETIEYLAPTYLKTEAGKKISLEGIGALAEPATGRVRVLYVAVFPSGPAELYDRDIFSYAGVLVHELRHIELHELGQSPGGWQEEVLCQQAAFASLKLMSAPEGVLLPYEIYLANPRAKRYQAWYDWYNQW